MPTAMDGESTTVTLRLAGAFAVLRDGREDITARVGSRKARALLKVLAVERGHLVPIDRLVDILWSARPPARPAENLATLVSRLRSALGPAVIVGGREGYRLGDPPTVQVDLDDAAAHADEAERRLAAGEPNFAAMAARRALSIVGDSPALAEEADADWAQPARVEAAGLARRTRHAAALDTDDHPEASRLAIDAIAADPFDEVAYRLLMRAHVRGGEPARAVAAFERLRADLAAELGSDPAAETRALHVSILRDEIAAPEPPVAAPRSAAPGPSRLAGRDAEQARLDEAWRRTVGGESGIVLVAGEAGIGKTRLATQTVDAAERSGATVLRARCYEAERSLFLQPIAEMIGGLVARRPPHQLRRMQHAHARALGVLVPSLALAGPSRRMAARMARARPPRSSAGWSSRRSRTCCGSCASARRWCCSSTTCTARACPRWSYFTT